MRKKVLITLLTAAILLSVMLCACGDKQNNASENSSIGTDAAVTETTAVLETTAEGGTVEQDSEGNKITKDKDGIVIAVEDKDGNPIEVTQYVTTHSWVEHSGKSSGDSIDPSINPKSDNGNKSNDSEKAETENNKKSDNSQKSNASENQEEQVEESIPVIIATLPDDEDLIELPEI